MKCKHSFKRARQPEQIAQRRADILNAAALLLERDGFDQVSLNGIAREAKIAKSNIYRYFESREEIFLQLLKSDWEEWLDKLEKELAEETIDGDVKKLAGIVSISISGNPRMCQLVSVLGSVLETNISEDALVKFKLETIQIATRMLTLFQTCVPAFPMERAYQIVTATTALIAGLWPLGNPSPVMNKVMELPELAPFKMEFATALERSLTLVFQGAMHELENDESNT